MRNDRPAGNCPPDSDSKLSQKIAPFAQLPITPELLELEDDEELLELELELEELDELLLELDDEELLELELEELDELLDEDDELDELGPEEPAPPHAVSRRARQAKSKGCFIMATGFDCFL